MTDQLERATNLLALLLETNRALTMTEIVGELSGQYPSGVAAQRAAFERDKSLLREVGVPIETQVLGGDQAGQTAYSITRTEYELPDLDLQDDERQALQLAVAASRSTDAQFALFKVGGQIDGGSTVRLDLPALEALPTLHDAVARRCPVEFVYRGSSRTLLPFALLLRSGFWYVIGQDTERQAVRTYRVDRMESDPVLGEPGSFVRPPDFDARVAFPDDPKELGDDNTARALVWVDQSRSARVLAELGDDSIAERHADGAVSVLVPCANVDAFRSWLLGYDIHAVVIDPPDVRAAVVDWLTAIVGSR